MPTAADIDWEVLPDAIPYEARTPEPTETPTRRTAGDIDWEVLPDDTSHSPSFGSELVAGATAPFKALAGSRKLVTNSDDELKTLLLREFAKQRSTTGGGALSKAGRVIGGIAGGVGEFAAAEAAGTTIAAETGPAAPFIGLGAASAAFGASGAYESFISAGTRALAEGKSADDALRIGKQVAKIGALTGAATAVALPGGVSGALERSAARRLASGKALAETLAPLTAAELKRQGEGAALRVGKMAAGGAAVGAGGQVVENLAEKEAGLDVSPLEGVVEQALIMGGLPVLIHAKALWKQAREVKATDPKKAEALQKTADDIATTELEKVDTKEEVPPPASAEAPKPTLTKEQVAANAVKRRVRQWQEQRRAEIKAARPEVPESGESTTGKSVIDEVRDNELFTRKDVQEHFRRTGARVPSNEEAADFLKRAWNRTQGETDTVDALINADESPTIRTAEEQRVLDEQRQREQQGQAEQEAITPKAAPEKDTRSEVERRIIERHRVEAQSDFDAAVSSGNKAEIRTAQKRLMRIQQVLQAPPAPAKGPIQPKAPLQKVPRSTFKPAVPETEPEAERGISVVDEIKANNARTIAEIQRLFPQAQLNREAARKLRDQAWGVAPKAPESAQAVVPTEAAKTPAAAPAKAEALTPEQQAEERARLEEEFSSDETDAKEPPPSVQPTEAPSQSSETPVAASASDEVVSGPPVPEPQPTNESEPTTPAPQAQTGVKTPSLTADGPSGDWSYETLKGLTLSQRAKLAGDLRRYTKDARLTDKEGMLEVGPKKIADVARDSIETKRKIAETEAAKPTEAIPQSDLIESIVAAARRNDYQIVERFPIKGSDGKFYSGYGFPQGVHSTNERGEPYYVRMHKVEGSTHGQRFDTRKEAEADLKRVSDARDQSFRSALQGMSDAGLEAQRKYWIKDTTPEPTTTTPSTKPAQQSRKERKLLRDSIAPGSSGLGHASDLLSTAKMLELPKGQVAKDLAAQGMEEHNIDFALRSYKGLETETQPQKYRIGNNPQTHTLLERLPQSESEKANGEQPVRVKNDKSGKEETVMESDLTPVKERSAEEKAAAKSAKRDLDAELEAAKLDPSVFTSDAEKRAALDRAKAKGKFAAPGEGGHTVEGARAEAEKAFGKLSDRVAFIHDPEADFGAHIDSDGRITVNAAKVAPGTVERVLLEEGLHGVWQHPEVQEAWRKFRASVTEEDIAKERVLRGQHNLPTDDESMREEAAISKLLNEPESSLAHRVWNAILHTLDRLFGVVVKPGSRTQLVEAARRFLTPEHSGKADTRYALPTIPAHGPVPPEVSKIKRLADKIGDSLTKARATAAHLWNSSRVREAIAYTRDVVGTKANLFGRQMANEIRRPIRKTFDGDKRAEDALAFAVEAKGDRAALDNFRSQILNSTAASDHWKSKAVGAIDFAIHHWDALQPHVERYNDITRHQVLGREHPAGIETLLRDGYVMHEQDIDDSPAGYSGATSSSGSGTGFRKNREHNTFADSIAAGVDPKSINAVDLLQKRIVRGETLINTRSWSESLRSSVDPQTTKPIADTPAVVTRADGSTYLQPPDGYTLEHIGFQPVAIHKGYEGLIRAVTDPSWFSQSLGKRSIMKSAQAGKAISLAFDTFHLGRVAFWDSLIKGTGIRTFKLPFPSYRKGLTLLDYTDAQIRDMAASGEIPNHWVASLTQDKARLNHLVKGGYNVGRISDALYQDLLHGLPIIGKLNRWIFDSFQRGAMAETGLLEFERAKLGNPALSDADIGRMVAKDLNTRFGQMGRQGLLKSGTGQDLARLLVLAPQWNEGLIRSELGAVKQGAQFLSNLAQGRGVYTGVLLRSVGGMAVAQFAANQIINMITRGHPTWENPEEGFGAKLSAWIPDKVGGGSGFFLHPLGLAAETTHLLMSKFEKTKDFHASLMAYGRSRASTAMRPVMTFITNEDFLGRKLKPGTVWGEMTKSAIPVPIGAPAYAGVAKQIVTGKESESFPGQFQKQIMSSVGIKTDSAPAPASRVATLAREFNRQKGIVPSAEFYTGDYQPLSAALAVGNTKDAQSALEELKKHKTTEQIQKHFRQWVNHPFTGQKGRESQFRMTLTPEQRDQYRQALDQRKKIAANVLKLLRDTKP